VKRLIALAVGLFGLRAYLRRRRRRAEPADELRERLAAQRTAAAEAPPEPAETAEPDVEAAPPPVVTDEPAPADVPPAAAGDVDARRAEVHARARQKIDDLSS
jgi:hypothetical protein